MADHQGSTAGPPGRFDRAIAAIDAANAEDPNVLVVGGGARPKELVHAEMVTAWIRELVEDPGEELLLAARAHHLRRWAVPRSDYPDGRSGYRKWRKDLQRRHAEETGRILRDAGYGDATIERVGEIIQKRRLASDPEVQALEDALCLVFIETQLAEFAAQHPREKVIDILLRSLRKMSAAGRAAAGRIELPDDARDLVLEAGARFEAA